MPASAAVYGCQGTELASDERDFFRDARPFGFILFARNATTGCKCLAVRSMRDPIGDVQARRSSSIRRVEGFSGSGRRTGRTGRRPGGLASCSTGIRIRAAKRPICARGSLPTSSGASV